MADFAVQPSIYFRNESDSLSGSCLITGGTVSSSAAEFLPVEIQHGKKIKGLPNRRENF